MKVNRSHHGDKPATQTYRDPIAKKSLPGLSTREHRKLTGIKTMSLGTNYLVRFLSSGVLPIFQNLNYKLQRGLSDVLCCPSKVTQKGFLSVGRVTRKTSYATRCK